MSIQIARLQSPSLQCLELIKSEMEGIIDEIRMPEADLYPNFKVELKNV
jgi:hypothetical protein